MLFQHYAVHCPLATLLSCCNMILPLTAELTAVGISWYKKFLFRFVFLCIFSSCCLSRLTACRGILEMTRYMFSGLQNFVHLPLLIQLITIVTLRPTLSVM